MLGGSTSKVAQKVGNETTGRCGLGWVRPTILDGVSNRRLHGRGPDRSWRIPESRWHRLSRIES